MQKYIFFEKEWNISTTIKSIQLLLNSFYLFILQKFWVTRWIFIIRYVTQMHNKSYKQIFTFHQRECMTSLISDFWADKYNTSQMATLISVPLNKSLFCYWLNSFKISNSKKNELPMNKAKFLAAKRNVQIRHLASFSCLYFQTKYQGRYCTAKEKEAAMIWAFNNLLSIIPTIQKTKVGSEPLK